MSWCFDFCESSPGFLRVKTCCECDREKKKKKMLNGRMCS